MEEAVFGKSGQHKRLVVQDEAGRQQEVIWWGGAAERAPQGSFDLAFTLGPDDYRGDGAIQLTWLEAREWQPAPLVTPTEYIDWRREIQPLAALQRIINNSQLAIPSSQFLVWAEGVSLPDLSTCTRHQLQPAEVLVIWTSPPGHDIFQQALAAVNPRQVYVVGQAPPFDTLPAFLGQLLGLVKYALAHKQGEVGLEALAAALGHRLTTARLGLDWLVAQGRLAFHVEEADLLVVRPARQAPSAVAAAIETMLRAALAETAAYRHFFGEASLHALQKTAEVDR